MLMRFNCAKTYRACIRERQGTRKAPSPVPVTGNGETLSGRWEVSRADWQDTTRGRLLEELS